MHARKKFCPTSRDGKKKSKNGELHDELKLKNVCFRLPKRYKYNGTCLTTFL